MKEFIKFMTRQFVVRGSPACEEKPARNTRDDDAPSKWASAPGTGLGAKG